MRKRCPYGDPHCPCQDGDACHYAAHGDSPPLTRVMAGPNAGARPRDLVAAEDTRRPSSVTTQVGGPGAA